MKVIQDSVEETRVVSFSELQDGEAFRMLNGDAVYIKAKSTVGGYSTNPSRRLHLGSGKAYFAGDDDRCVRVDAHVHVKGDL